jgi:hypothetical protein
VSRKIIEYYAKDAYCDFALKYMKRVEEEESLLGAGYHLLAVARKA